MININIQDFVSRLHSARGRNGRYSARCPAHDDKHASLSVTESNDGKILLKCHAGCTAEQIVSAMGLELSDLFMQESRPPAACSANGSNAHYGSNAVVYDYEDTDGNIIAKKLRYPNKSFCWLSRNPKNGKFEKGRSHCKAPLLYNMYDCKDLQSVYIVEGEKDVDTLKRYKKNAVSFPDGVQSKWSPEYAEFFRNKTVAVIRDNDEPGREFAETLARRLFETAKSIRIVDLSKIWENMPDKADISDYLAVFPDGMENVSRLANSTEEWKPTVDMSRYIRLSTVNSVKTEWLWYPYIPLGKITLMTADPGTGKTFLSLYLASQVSTGKPFYGQELYNKAGTVVYQTAEDGIADTLKPRLEPMDPDFENIYIFDESKESLSLSDERVEQIMQELHPKLMIFDPLQAYLGADVDMHRANEVRPVLGRIAHLAEKYKCAVLFIMHNNKMSQSMALYRALGSIDISAVARSMLILGKNPDNPSKGKIMCHEKSSLAPHGRSILFEIDPTKGGIVFGGFSDLKADDVLNIRSEAKEKPSPKRDSVADMLLQFFEGNDYITMHSINELCEEFECSRATLFRAKDTLQLQSFNTNFGKNKTTYWLMPDVDVLKFKQEHGLLSDNDDIPF